jgi:prepilin-type N-terminal cleavage/methylation domain-containing protein
MTKFINTNKKNLAFTLLEMSITILILGIILVGAINFQINIKERSKENITADKIEKIEQAIRAYFIQNEKLPCPADITSLKTDSSYGNELRTNGSCIVNNSNFLNNSLIYGGVPTKVLDLNNDYGIDAWNDKIAYIVSKSYSDSKIYLVGNSGTLKIKNIAGTKITDEAIYVLISGGKNRNGVFANGSQLTIDSSLTDSANVFSTGFSGTFIKDVNTNSFDDLVAFKKKNDLIFGNDMETLSCTLKELGDVDSDWTYSSYSSCDSSGICEQGTNIISENSCANSKISKNPDNSSTSGVSYKPVRSCLEYGQWGNIIYKCISGCGESNIASITTDMMSTAGILPNYINLNYLERGKLEEELILECIGSKVGYIKLQCQSDGTWTYVGGDCYSNTYTSTKTTCANSTLNSNSNYFTFSTTTGTTNVSGVVSGSCSTGYTVQSGGSSTITATCQSDGSWSFSGGPCIATTCANSTLNSNSNYFTFSTTTGTTNVSGVVSGSCSTGYKVQSGGSSTITATCQSDGSWSFSGGPCIVSDGSCKNSVLDTNSVHFLFLYTDTTATTSNGNSQWSGSCASGYAVPASGDYNLMATCTNGAWVYYGGPCSLKCNNSTLNGNSSHFYFTTITGTTAVGFSVSASSCDTGYSVSGSYNMIATCSVGPSTWTFSGGPCVASCLNSTVNNNTKHYTFSYSSTYTNSGTTLWGSCASGYTASGGYTFTATCTNGVWSYSGNSCI